MFHITVKLLSFLALLQLWYETSHCNEIENNYPIYLPKFSVNDHLTLELGVFMDDAMYRTYVTNFTDYYAESRLKEYITTIFNDIQILYKNPYLTPRISFKIVHYEIFKIQPDKLSASDIRNWNALAYLNAFCLYQSRLPDRNWDHAVLLTGHDLTYTEMGSKISGLTRVTGVCESESACTVVEGFDFSAALVGAHEIAHALGVNHDEPNCDSSNIMAQSLGPGRIGWSTCSVNELQKRMKALDDEGRNCLRETSSEKPALDLEGLPLPGIQFNAHEQCALVFSSSHRQRPVPSDNANNVCHMMYCGLGFLGPIISSNPALEGTVCGEGKYCQFGRCISMPSGSSAYPVAINGQWSSWSSIDCGQCSCGPIMGSVGVISSSRTCTNPKPSDGGRSCYGSKIRGSICKEFCPYSKYSAKSYVKRVCHERQRQNWDFSLTGTGIRLSESTCKIHCHSRETGKYKRGYRYFGDMMPNGSPCGPQSYCVNGECLPLNCNDQALAADGQSCPAGGWDFCSLSESDHWDDWTSWTTCSASCGHGTRSRSRECKGIRCSTKQENQWEPCQTTSCVGDEYLSLWSSWSEWSQCSSTCDKNAVATRKRSCKNDHCRQSEQRETKACFSLLYSSDCPNPEIEWSTWSLWSLCSRTCGQGTTHRTRFCTKQGCQGTPKETRPCRSSECDYHGKLSSWRHFGPCNVTCGPGFKIRRRFCLKPPCSVSDAVLIDEKPCFTVSCYQWGGWGSWSECQPDFIFRQPFRLRIRQCYDSGWSTAFNCTGKGFDEVVC